MLRGAPAEALRAPDGAPEGPRDFPFSSHCREVEGLIAGWLTAA